MIVTPAPPGSPKGNRVSAERWAGFLAQLGHEVAVVEQYAGEDADLMLALHAGRSAASIERWNRRGPLVLALTGTDVYGDVTTDPAMVRSVAAADRLLVLQPLAIQRLAPADRDRARVVYQSCSAPAQRGRPGPGFEVCVLAHLRPVKDPLLAGSAAALLAPDSRVRITHAGASLDPGVEAGVRALVSSRYVWLGELPRPRALELLASSHALLLTSISEGGANVVTEAIACGTPVVSTRIDGSLGLLGDDYPAYVDVGDAAGVARLLERMSRDRPLRDELASRIRARAHLVAPDGERERLRALVAELV